MLLFSVTRKSKRQGGKTLCRSAIYKILTNPFYCGQMIRNGEIYQGRHEPMVSPEEFGRVQDLLGRKGKPRGKKMNFAFTGLIRCRECGCMVTAEEKVNRYGYHYTYYHCTKKRRDTWCVQRSIRLEELENQILGYLSRITISGRFASWALKYLWKVSEKELSTQKDIRKSLEKALDQNQKHLGALIQMRYRELVSDEEFLKQKRALTRYQPEKEAKPLKSKVTSFLAHCLAADPEGRPSVGLGTDWRVESGKVAGLGLTHEGSLLHLSLFNRGDGSGKLARYSRMARFTERRGRH